MTRNGIISWISIFCLTTFLVVNTWPTKVEDKSYIDQTVKHNPDLDKMQPRQIHASGRVMSIDVQFTKSGQSLVGSAVVDGSTRSFVIACVGGIPKLTIDGSGAITPTSYSLSPTFSATYSIVGVFSSTQTLSIDSSTACFGSSSRASSGTSSGGCVPSGPCCAGCLSPANTPLYGTVTNKTGDAVTCIPDSMLFTYIGGAQWTTSSYGCCGVGVLSFECASGNLQVSSTGFQGGSVLPSSQNCSPLALVFNITLNIGCSGSFTLTITE